MIPTPQEARSRQTAMEAERHWHTSRLTDLAARWRQEAEYHDVERNEPLMASVLESCAKEIEELIAERTK